MAPSIEGDVATAADRCTECGREAESVVGEFIVEHSGQTRKVSDSYMQCVGCGVVSYVGAQISAHEHAVAACIREIDGLLSADELRAIRMKYSLRQIDLEKMLSTGPKTWTRWERGKVPQSKTADKLIRLLAINPSLVLRFMRDARIDNAEAEATLVQAEKDAKHAAWLSVRDEVEAAEGSVVSEDYVARVFDGAFSAGAGTRSLARQAA